MTLSLTVANIWVIVPAYQMASRVLLQAPAGAAYGIGFYQALPGMPAAGDTDPPIIPAGGSVELSTTYPIYCKAIPADAAGKALFGPLA